MLQLVLGISVYGVCLLMFGGLTWQELAALKAIAAKEGDASEERAR